MEIAIGRPAVIEVGSAYPSLKAFAYEKLALSGKLTRSPHHKDVDTVDGETAWSCRRQSSRRAFQRRSPFRGPPISRGYTGLAFCCSDRMSTTPSPLACSTRADPARAEPHRVRRPGRRAGMRLISRQSPARFFERRLRRRRGRAAERAGARRRAGRGDDSARIQAAIDQVSAMPQNADGIRGAVLLKRGRLKWERRS